MKRKLAQYSLSVQVTTVHPCKQRECMVDQGYWAFILKRCVFVFGVSVCTHDSSRFLLVQTLYGQIRVCSIRFCTSCLAAGVELM